MIRQLNLHATHLSFSDGRSVLHERGAGGGLQSFTVPHAHKATSKFINVLCLLIFSIVDRLP